MTDVPLRDRLDQIVGGIAILIGSESDEGGLGTGDEAELRRFTGERLPLAFWRLAFRKDVEPLIDDLAGGGSRNPIELAFATLMKAMALMGPLARAPERQELGAAVALDGYSEARFVRLLRARGPALVREIETAVRWCQAKGRGIAWAGTARLLLAAFAPGRPFDPEQQSRHQARAYYATAAKSERA
jgi:hypothetical protein